MPVQPVSLLGATQELYWVGFIHVLTNDVQVTIWPRLNYVLAVLGSNSSRADFCA